MFIGSMGYIRSASGAPALVVVGGGAIGAAPAAAPPEESNLVIPVAADADDGAYFFSWLSDTSGSLGAGAVQGHYSGFALRAGFRFTGVTVPQGATITAASLLLSVIGSAGSAFGNLRGVASDDAPAWDGSHNPNTVESAVGGTTALVALTSANMADVDVTAIVQELVNRAGWASGNAMAFWGDTDNVAGEYVDWNDYSINPALVASLDITYEV